MVEALPFRRDTNRRGGFTLIEVVIALAIFVFGALAIIRIFPPALGVIQNSGDRLTAVNLNRSVLARYARNPERIPDAIYDDPSATNWRDNLVGSVAGSPRRNNSIPSSSINDVTKEFNESALGHFKNIVGERHVIPRNGIVLTQFRFTGAPLIYQEDTVSGVIVDGVTKTLDFSKATKDSDNQLYLVPPATQPPASDKIYVSYRWTNSSTGQARIWGVEDELLIPPTAPDTNYKVTRPSPVDGSVKVRIRRPIAVNPAPTSALGLLDFKDPAAPSPVSPNPPTLLVAAGTSLSIDYSVEDWRWLVYDGNPNVVRQGDNSKYRALKLPVPLLDRDLGTFASTYFPTSDPNKSRRDNTALTDSLYDIEPKTGQVTFDTSTAVDPTSIPSARVIYRTSDNWANQLSVAARSYLISTNGPSLEPWRDCGFDTNETAQNNLYFKPSEAGKTLLVSYSYLDAIGVERNIDGRIITIDNTIKDATGGMPANLAVGGRVSRAELTDIDGISLGNTTPNPSRVISIREIKGVSIQARTAWLDGNHFTQASSIGFREVNN